MRRAEFTRLTGVTADFFNSLVRRDEFPFLRRPQTGGGWGNYPPAMAYKTLLAFALADAGATHSGAGDFIEVEFKLLARREPNPTKLSKANIYLGYVRIASSEFDPEIKRYTQMTIRLPICGSIEEVAQEVASLQSRPDRDGLHGLVLINASEHLRTLQRRVAENQLDPAILDDALAQEESFE